VSEGKTVVAQSLRIRKSKSGGEQNSSEVRLPGLQGVERVLVGGLKRELGVARSGKQRRPDRRKKWGELVTG